MGLMPPPSRSAIRASQARLSIAWAIAVSQPVCCDKWIGSLILCVVVCIYTFLGGMRGANWVQTFQAILLLTFGAIGFVAITRQLGGFGNVMQNVLRDRTAQLAFMLPRDLLLMPALAASGVAVFHRRAL